MWAFYFTYCWLASSFCGNCWTVRTVRLLEPSVQAMPAVVSYTIQIFQFVINLCFADRTASSMTASRNEESWWTRLVDSSQDDDSSDDSTITPQTQVRLGGSPRAISRGSSDLTRSSARITGQNNRQSSSSFMSGVFQNLHRRFSMYNRRPRGHSLWLPGNRDSDDWRRCHGMSSNEYEKTKRRIRQIMRFAQQDADDDVHTRVSFPEVSHTSKLDELLDFFLNCTALTGSETHLQKEARKGSEKSFLFHMCLRSCERCTI